MSNASLLIVTIGIVACLTAAATAVRSVSRIWLRHWVERRLSGAQTAAPRANPRMPNAHAGFWTGSGWPSLWTAS